MENIECKRAELEDVLDLDDDGISECKYAVCVTGLNPDKTESEYFKTLQVFSDPDKAIEFAWCVGSDNMTDRPDGIRTFLVTVEEAIESEPNSDEFDFEGTIFKTEVIL